jgi:protein SCO1/2
LPSNVLEKIGIDQRLGARLPLDVELVDDAGRRRPLRDFFDGRPVVLSFVYFRCPMLCDMSLNGLLAALKTLRLDVGRDFDVLTVSFDPRETPAMAQAKKEGYLRQYDRPGAGARWLWCTGEEASIRALTEACGFRYAYDERSDQWAHATGILVITPDGTVSRYFYGVEFSPRDLRLGLVEASQNKVGSWADQVLLLCYEYDPAAGKYGFAILSSLRIGALLTLGGLALFIAAAARKERRKSSERAS